MKDTRKCSALLAAGAGAAICLTSGGAQAAMVTGLFRSSNTSAGTATGASDWKRAYFFDAKAFNVPGLNWMGIPNMIYLNIGAPAVGVTTYLQVAGNPAGAHLLMNPGQTIDSALNWHNYVRMTTGTYFNGSSEKYYAVRFTTNSGANWKYGWWRMTWIATDRIQVRGWGYQSLSDTATLTLADSITARKLGLADGREKLVWSNANEEGVARYEVQAKDASGAWNAVSSEVPGAGMYSIAVPKGNECRVVVEKVDGTAENIAF